MTGNAESGLFPGLSRVFSQGFFYWRTPEGRTYDQILMPCRKGVFPFYASLIGLFFLLISFTFSQVRILPRNLFALFLFCPLLGVGSFQFQGSPIDPCPALSALLPRGRRQSPTENPRVPIGPVLSFLARSGHIVIHVYFLGYLSQFPSPLPGFDENF